VRKVVRALLSAMPDGPILRRSLALRACQQMNGGRAGGERHREREEEERHFHGSGSGHESRRLGT